MENKEGAEVLLDETLEKSFNDALEGVKTSHDIPKKDAEKDLEKAKKAAVAEEDEEAEVEEEEEETEGEKDKFVKKSIEDQLLEDTEATAAMDVAPFLSELSKAFDASIEALAEGFSRRISKVETMVKSQGKLMLAQADLQKSIAEKTEKIGKTAIPSSSIKRLQKSRFDAGDEPIEVDGPAILMKSRDWLIKGKIDLLEAGKIEGRINKGLLGTINDGLDHKVDTLLREAS